MQRPLTATINPDGTLQDVSEEVARICGIPRRDLEGSRLTSHMIPQHRTRFDCELEAVLNGDEQHGRVHCTLLGADSIGRKLVIQLTPGREGRVELRFSQYHQPESFKKASHLVLLHTGRLVPVARRVLAIARQSTSKEELVMGGLKVLAEATNAQAGAAIEWSHIKGDGPIVSIGDFDRAHLEGIYRAAIMARLTRGDVVVKETSLDGSDAGSCLLILPLLTSTSPIGIIVLQIARESELVPEEQQSLIILGEIMGLGLRALTTSSERPSREPAQRKGDMEAMGALGRLSSGLNHEINNAATVLRTNIEQFLLHRDDYQSTQGTVTEGAIKDTLSALDAVRDITAAMKAFGPEESRRFGEVDVLRILGTVHRSVQFYAKRGINIELDIPEDELPRVQARSHHLIRALFLIFVELFEASVESSIELGVRISLRAGDDEVQMTIVVTAGPFSLPTVLLAQLEKGGALARQVSEAGGSLTHTVDHEGNLSMTIALAEATGRRRRRSPSSIAASPYRRGTILIVDDEVAVIRSLRRVLDPYYDILAAGSGEEALEILKSSRQIEAILYDVSMPRLDGVEFYEEVKRTQMRYADRIVFVKAGAYDAEIGDFLAGTSNPVVDKPFDLPELNNLLASMLM